MQAMRVIILVSALLISGCETIPYSEQSGTIPYSEQSGPRTITLDGDSYSEAELGAFNTWRCTGYGSSDRTLVEVGTFTRESMSEFGFILYDGGNTGELTNYQRQGINHRWDWGTNNSDHATYALVINPHGGALYYDFTTSREKGPDDLFSCQRR
jgi:hypothetical protein